MYQSASNKMDQSQGSKTDQALCNNKYNKDSKTEVKLWKINDFLFMTQIDNVNLFKLNGYVDRYQEEQQRYRDRVNASSIKFLLLNPAIHFTSVALESRAVIVAGGTMQPTSEFKDQLFACAGIHPDQVHEFSYGHVIARENFLAVALDKGPSGLNLDFSYQMRDSPQLINECGRLLLNVCAVIPGGIVCFFSSFDYANKIYSQWGKTGILERLNLKKKV
ncbi:hypothetical protein QZH41_002297 [Actinostola sp. cb2023]|nr:hypothetical protein QZH41_002297 [Actinostola sp. cb2023]